MVSDSFSSLHFFLMSIRSVLRILFFFLIFLFLFVFLNNFTHFLSNLILKLFARVITVTQKQLSTEDLNLLTENGVCRVSTLWAGFKSQPTWTTTNGGNGDNQLRDGGLRPTTGENDGDMVNQLFPSKKMV